jgi:serine phosphatase RsbU (regulator of sigma subunit)/anti-anti-sigma regulatory factor
MTLPTRPVENPRASILIVDDDADMRELIAHALREEPNRHIAQAASANDARAALAQSDFDLVITDISMPGEGGLSLMQWAQENRPGPVWIVLTGRGTFDTAVKALQLGAFDFHSKPIRLPESLRNAVRNAIAHGRLLAERDRLQGELEERNARLRKHVGQLQAACDLLEGQTDALRADLRRAGIIQQALLPRNAPDLGAFHVRAHYRPSQNVGGDLYDVARLSERHVALLVADAAGHGLAAAMLAVLFRSQLPFVDPDTGSPHAPRDVLHSVNQSFCRMLPTPGLFLTAAYCLLDTQTSEATIASAGHPPLLWLRRGSNVERIFHTGPAIGLHPDADFTQTHIGLERGDGLLFYSDGLYERFSPTDEAPSDRIAAAFRETDLGAAAAFERLFGAAGSEQDGQPIEDDVTALLLAAQPGTSLLDNGAPPPLAAPGPPPCESETFVGGDARRRTFSIRGSGAWTGSAAFYAECLAVIGGGHDVMIDLTLCQQLDSTFLGTIHQLCELADGADVEFRLQGAAPGVEALFEELGMQNVIDHIVPRMLPLPTKMARLDADEPNSWARAQRLLRAHEGLAALNERNRREFDPLLAQLRQEIEAH